MAYGIKLMVWGEYASFNRPEMKVERVSYDVMTPSAARGILEAIYWKPEMAWVVDAIHVLNPIRFTHVRRNEISSKIPAKGKTGAGTAMRTGTGNLGVNVADAAQRQQRAAMILCDVRYGIQAHLEIRKSTDSDGQTMDKPEAKHLDMFRRRATRGQYFHHPYLGAREFPASFQWVEEFPDCPDQLRGEKELGYMLHDIEYQPDPDGVVVEANTGVRLSAQPRFFRAKLVDGVLEVPPLQNARA